MASNPPNGSVHQLNPRFSPRFAGPIAGRFAGRRTIAAAATVLLSMTGVTSAVAATQVTETNPRKLVAVGPVNAENGFPSWYEDSTGTRVELCLDDQNPLCGFLPGDIPDESVPISFPDNFPQEAFYMLASSGLDLPGGGKATLVLGLEAAFANTVTDGDQMVFGRQRIVVKGAPANATLTFKHPYGTITVDTDGTGAGRLVEDISPAVGNFTTALKSNIGPFLKWDPATAPAAPDGYLGDPNQNHTVAGGLLGYNKFSVSGGGLALETDQFTLQGKIATNSGVSADSAVVNGNMIDVFASSKPSAQLQVEAQAGKFALTPMATDADSGRFYARIPFTGTAPTSVKITNIADKPASSGTVTVTKPSSITVTSATFDGTKLDVAAISSTGDPLEVVGVGPLVNPATAGAPAQGSWTLNAPPAKVTVRNAAGDSASLAVSVSGGIATQAGLPPLSPAPDPGPAVDTGTGTTTPGGGTTTPATLSAAATPATATVARGASVQLDGSASTGAVSYKWTQVDGPAVTLTGDTTAKPTVSVPFYARTTDTAPLPAAAAGPAHIKLVVTAQDGSTSEATVALTIQTDAVAIDAGSRHRLGTELRITGTSALAGSTGVLTPATSVVVYDMTSGTAVKIGTAQVDTLGVWSYKAKPGPARQITRVMVQSTRGGTATAAIATR